MIPIPAGTFEMGTREGVYGGEDTERPVHSVNISAFEMSRTTITRELWNELIPWDSSSFPYSDYMPANNVTWFDAVNFCNLLSEAHGLTPCYTLTDVAFDSLNNHIKDAEVTCNWDANGYRLPTEAEWEYACRAGTTTRFNLGDSVFDLNRAAWYLCNSGIEVHPVGEKEPNNFGLYDMHGNGWEWVWDWSSLGYYSESPVQDPRGPETGATGQFERVVRGGAYARRAFNCRCGRRYSQPPGFRTTGYTFRVVRKAAE